MRLRNVVLGLLSNIECHHRRGCKGRSGPPDVAGRGSRPAKEPGPTLKWDQACNLLRRAGVLADEQELLLQDAAVRGHDAAGIVADQQVACLGSENVEGQVLD